MNKPKINYFVAEIRIEYQEIIILENYFNQKDKALKACDCLSKNINSDFIVFGKIISGDFVKYNIITPNFDKFKITFEKFADGLAAILYDDTHIEHSLSVFSNN